MTEEKTPNEELVRKLNAVLGWEIRALTLYSHYAAYIRGIHRLHLKPFFEAEATESLGHAAAVLTEIVKLNGTAVTDRDKTPIIHTTDYTVMLNEAMKTEAHAASSYKAFLELPGIERELHDAIEQIYFAEERSVEELKQLIP